MLHSFLVTANCHTVPYHTGPPWHRFATNIRPIKIAKCTCPAGMGRNSGECIHYPGVGGALLLPLFCWQCVCVVCAREKEGRFKDFCLLFYKLGLYVGFSEAVHCCRTHLLSQRWLALEVRAPLDPVLVACHRFKRIQDTYHTMCVMCLPEILIFEYVLSWPACPTSRRGPELNPGSLERPEG